MIPKTIFIINSKRSQSIELKSFISDAMNYLGNYLCAVLYTDYAGHAIELAKKYSIEGVDLIISIGGDGTFNEVINGIILSGKTNTPVCLIPNGTGNDFCRAQNFSFDKGRILTALKYRTYLFYDVGKYDT